MIQANKASPRRIDVLVSGAMIVTVDADRRILADGSLAVDGGRIVAIGPRGEIDARFDPARRIDGAGLLVTPGFVNAHVHVTGDPLTRGFMPDTTDYRDPDTFMRWVLPRYLSQTPQDEHLSARIAALAMLRCGITSFAEAGTIRHLAEAAAGIDALGIRARIGVWTEGRAFVPDQDPGALADAAIAAMEAALDAWPQTGDARIAAWPLLVGHNTNSDRVWQAASQLAGARGLRVAAHMSPYRGDTDWYLREYGRRPIEYLERLGVLDGNLVLTHLIWLSDDEARLLVERGVHGVFCPLAALKGAFGVGQAGRLPEMARAGFNFALGTDGYDCDIMRLMPLAAGLYKDARQDFAIFPAEQMLEAITINGARAMGLDHEIGSLETGKRADFVCHEIDRPELRPLHDPVGQLVWSADGRGVRSVWVDGECLIEDRRSTRIDEAELFASVQQAGERLVARAGLERTGRWPLIAG